MNTEAVILMLVIVPLVWGGLIYMLRLALRYEKRKAEKGNG